ncbi:hypothetical protein BCR36DRAFT_136320 [Piromyces finnis]|uniref:Uncharacterized protein n=1 Tax=Piromyces finnis TaxID=1754191 RepID=A0A1Y1VKX6_9FUNG|nr:hypothetical protein BCR36DRAFT_136320 [Piromyces finnis]|eukprot:ORX57766.1 hypothetical protein BCR36DRAFT_136320 [Piromyces finnis]
MDQDVDVDDIAQVEMMEEMEKMLPLINEEELFNIELPKEPIPTDDSKKIKIFQNLIDIPEIKAKVNTLMPPNIQLQSPIVQQISPINGNLPFIPQPGMIRPNSNFIPPNIPIQMNPNMRPPMISFPPNVRPQLPPMGMPVPPNGMVPMNIPPNTQVRPLPNRQIPINQPLPHKKPFKQNTVHSTEQLSKKPLSTSASAVISAAPQLRDLQKELTTLVPSSLRRRGPTTKLPRKSTMGSNSLKPTINLAPEFDENGQIKISTVPETSKPKENNINNKQDDYEAFMKEVSGLL